MSFILLGKASDGTLSLLSNESFSSRAKALAQLSQITADPKFDRWDDEVIALDLDGGTQVLLVRPANTLAETEPEHEVEPEPDPEPEAEPELEQEPVLETEPEPEPEVGDGHDEETGSAIAAVISDLSEDSETAFVSEQQTDEVGSDEAPQSLKDALTRTAAQLESEGIVAPESVGPEESPETAEEATSAAWPWDTAPDTKGFDIDALEAPGNDEGSLVRAPGDDETMAASRPMIMGAYDETSLSDAAIEPPAGEDPPPASEAVIADAVTPQVPVEAIEVSTDDEAVDDSATAPEVTAVEIPADDTSDFVDLPPASVTPPIDTMTCEDCVYTESCPNKGQREPASCGSFQWK